MTDLMIGGLSSGLVLAAMAAMAVLDARRAVVDPRLVLAFLAAAAVWRYLSPDGGSPWTPWTGMALGIAAVALPIIVAQLRGRRWPLYPGDAMMLGGSVFCSVRSVSPGRCCSDRRSRSPTGFGFSGGAAGASTKASCRSAPA